MSILIKTRKAGTHSYRIPALKIYAETVGFEPTRPKRTYRISSATSYDHLSTSPFGQRHEHYKVFLSFRQ